MPLNCDVPTILRLTNIQIAVYNGNVEAVVELLDNGADVDTEIDRDGSTVLELAAKMRRMDVLRTLLRRGASADHCDQFGVDVYVSCWYPRLAHTEVFSSRDVFNVLSEYIALEHTYTWGTSQSITVLQVAATTVKGPDIEALISYGHNIEGKDKVGRTALCYAATFGNTSAFFALLAQGADMDYESHSVETMLQAAITGEALEIASPYTPSEDFEAIAGYLLQYGSPDLDLVFDISTDSPANPASIRGRKATLRQIAEANGPEVEAWFLTLLRESGHPHQFTKEDECRLNALRRGEHTIQGCVLGEDEDSLRDDGVDHSDTDDDGGDDDIDDDDDDESNAKFAQDERSDAEEEEQFWDAEEDV